MSGIAGFAALDGRPADAATAWKMADAMRHRVRDGGSRGVLGAAAFAAGSSRAVAELHRCMVTADARIDNRVDLARALRLSASDVEAMTDAEIILRAYLEWNTDCPAHLIGDFAFAVWDEPRRLLLCARDHLGARPLCVYTNGSFCAFGSEPKALLAHAGVPAVVNEERIVCHFHPELLFHDKRITYYRGIDRLEPAHALVVTTSGSRLRRYWNLDPFAAADCSDEHECAERFRELFVQAVNRRLPSDRKVASTLSGGLDSSSVACTARDLLRERDLGPLPTYSAVFDHVPGADERDWIRLVTETGGFEPHFVHPDEHSPLVDLDAMLRLSDGPFYGTNYFIHWPVYRAAASAGVTIMMDGEDGDTTVSHGMDQLAQLVQRGSWREFAAECDAVVRAFDNERTYASRLGMLHAHAIPYLESLAAAGRWPQFLRATGDVSTLFGVPHTRLVVRHGLKQSRVARVARVALRRRPAGGVATPSVMSDDLIREHRVDERLRELAAARRPVYPAHERQSHARYLSSGALPYALESVDRIAAYWGVDVTHPFCDVELAEFALSVPARLKLRNGVSRLIMREAFKGVLPEPVRTRGGKGDLSGVSERGMIEFESDAIRSLAEAGSIGSNPYVDAARVRAAAEEALHSRDARALSGVWQTLVLTRWLSLG